MSPPIDCVFFLHVMIACAHDSLTQMEGTILRMLRMAQSGGTSVFTKGKNHMEEQMEESFFRDRQEDNRKMIGQLPHNHQGDYCQ